MYFMVAHLRVRGLVEWLSVSFFGQGDHAHLLWLPRGSLFLGGCWDGRRSLSLSLIPGSSTWSLYFAICHRLPMHLPSPSRLGFQSLSTKIAGRVSGAWDWVQPLVLPFFWELGFHLKVTTICQVQALVTVPEFLSGVLALSLLNIHPPPHPCILPGHCYLNF